MRDFIEELQGEIDRLQTLATCLELAAATNFLQDESELKGFMLNIAHFQNIYCRHLNTTLEQRTKANPHTKGEALC